MCEFMSVTANVPAKIHRGSSPHRTSYPCKRASVFQFARFTQLSRSWILRVWRPPPHDIANARSANRLQLLATRTPTDALFDCLRENDFIYKFKIDPRTGRLQFLLWTKEDTVRRLREHCDILVLDCTYKTNKYNLPLLNIIVVAGMDTILPVAQCWLPGEAEPDFVWALRNLQELLTTYAIRVPCVVLTDRQLACMNALKAVMPHDRPQPSHGCSAVHTPELVPKCAHLFPNGVLF